MSLAKKYSVPQEIALLYDFLNSADLRTYIENGEQHVRSDELATPAQLEVWMRKRGLVKRDEPVTSDDHQRALGLRSALRSYLQFPPDSRAASQKSSECVNRMSKLYPLVIKIDRRGTLKLQSVHDGDGLGRVLAELFSLAENGRLDRLKMCGSVECRWIFFDRSKPGNRRWCSSFLCGNRQKTRDYRKRARAKTLGKSA